MEIDDFPDELLCEIFNNFDRADIIVGHFVCRGWHCCLRKINGRNFLNYAAMKGYINLLIWASQLGAQINCNFAPKLVRAGCMETLLWLVENNLWHNIVVNARTRAGETGFHAVLDKAPLSKKSELISWLLMCDDRLCVDPSNKFWENVGRTGDENIYSFMKKICAVNLTCIACGAVKYGQETMFDLILLESASGAVSLCYVPLVEQIAAVGSMSMLHTILQYIPSITPDVAVAVRNGACVGGFTEPLDWLWNSSAWQIHLDRLVEFDDYITLAVQNCHVNILAWLISHNIANGFSYQAVKTGSIPVLDWLNEKNMVRESDIGYAIENGQVAVLDWFAKHSFKIRSNNWSLAVKYTTGTMDFSLLEWFHTTNIHHEDLYESVFGTHWLVISSANKLAVMRWLHDHGYVSNKYGWITGDNLDEDLLCKLSYIPDMGTVMRKGIFRFLDLLNDVIDHCNHRNIATIDISWGRCCDVAARVKNTKLLRDLVSFGAPISPETWKNALSFEKVWYWTDRSVKTLAQDRKTELIEAGFQIILWLQGRGYRNWNSKLITEVFRADRIDIFQWALKNEIPWDKQSGSPIGKNLLEWSRNRNNHHDPLYNWILAYRGSFSRSGRAYGPALTGVGDEMKKEGRKRKRAEEKEEVKRKKVKRKRKEEKEEVKRKRKGEKGKELKRKRR